MRILLPARIAGLITAWLLAAASLAGVQLPPQDLAGEYDVGTMVITVFRLPDGSFTLLVPGQPLYHLLPQSGLRFGLKELPLFAVEFSRDAAGAITQFQMFQPPPQQNFVARKRRNERVAPELIAALPGQYDAGPITLTVTAQLGDTLTLAVPGQPLYHLRPETGMRFGIRELPAFAVEFARDASGVITHLQMFQPPPQGNFVAVRRGTAQPAAARPVPTAPPATVAPPPPPAPGSAAAAPVPPVPPVRTQPPTATSASAGRGGAPSPPKGTARSSGAADAATTTATKLSTAPPGSCDELAAHPDDDGKPAGIAGVADESIVAARAIPACTQAAKAAPKNGRLQFQLGRAYWAAKQHGDAIDAFLKAEELGYGPAYFYLAEAYDYGFVEGEKADADLATAIYALAAEAGFLPAVAMLGYDTGAAPAAFEAAAFTRPDWMRALRTGDVYVLNQAQRLAVLEYLAGMQSLVSDGSHEYSAACVPRIDPGLTGFLERQVDAEMMKTALSGAAKNARQEGVDDIYLLVSNNRGCTGADFEKVYQTIWNYSRTGYPPAFAVAASRAGTPVLPAGLEGRILLACYRYADFLLESSFGTRFGTREELVTYCQCVAPKIVASSLPESDREAFAPNFESTRDRVSRAHPEIMKPLNESCAVRK